MVPLICSNILHMILVKKNKLQAIAIPISIKLFGPNKTWRGFIMVIFINSCFQSLLNNIMSMQDGMTAIGTGAALGLIYMLFELPNSWVKRQLGIQAGEKAKKNGETLNEGKFSFPIIFNESKSGILATLSCLYITCFSDSARKASALE